jgi:hypothetical protein
VESRERVQIKRHEMPLMRWVFSRNLSLSKICPMVFVRWFRPDHPLIQKGGIIMEAILVIFTVLFCTALLYVIAFAITTLWRRIREWRAIDKDNEKDLRT